LSDALLDAFRDVVLALIPKLAYYVQWEYRVVSVSPGPPVTVSGLPVNPKCPIASPNGTSDIVVRPGPCGCYAIPAVGSIVAIGFNDADPGKPYIAGMDPSANATAVFLSASGQPVARVGDTVTITSAEILAASMVAGSNPVTVTLPLQCKITSGSAVVQSP
jgi:hypothetical protein